ncbi:MAG: NADH-quinone oxidoreductase subunit NuoE [Halobacteriota archaeon]|nr:NADH-quinone oxidoreductase subunit NuoE [Halobacteriota archaeon]
MDMNQLDDIIDKYDGQEGFLIQLLLEIQSEFNWIPGESIELISSKFQIPISQIYRVASFYQAMSLTPIGRHLVQVCMGTACHVRGAKKILDNIADSLNISEGETTEDMKFTLRRVNCLGCCAMGPVIRIGEEYHGNVTPSKVGDILEKYD